MDATAERVQTLREVGLLPRPTPMYPGGGGSSGRYSPELVERAREALDLAEAHHHQLHFAVAVMYARGRYSIPEGKLRRALLRVLTRTRADLRRAAADPLGQKTPEDAAIDAGPVLAKRMARDPEMAAARRRIPRSKERPKNAVLETFATGMLQAHLGGDTPSEEAIAAMVRMGGVHDVLGAEVAGEFAELMQQEDFAALRIDDVIAAVKQASLADLERAREDAVLQTDRRTLENAVETLFSPAPGQRITFPATDEMRLLAALRNLAAMFNDPDEYERGIALVRKMSALIEALVAFGEFLPSDLRPFARLIESPTEEDMTSGQRARFEALMVEFIDKYPHHGDALRVALEQ